MNIIRITTTFTGAVQPLFVQAGRAAAFLRDIFTASSQSVQPLVGRVKSHPVAALFCAVPLALAAGYMIYHRILTSKESQPLPDLKALLAAEDPYAAIQSFLDKYDVQGDVKLEAIRMLRESAKADAEKAEIVKEGNNDSSAAYLKACERIQGALRYPGDDLRPELEQLYIECADKAIGTDSDAEAALAIKYLLGSTMPREDLYRRYHAGLSYPSLHAGFLECVKSIPGSPSKRFDLLLDLCKNLKNPSVEIRRSSAKVYLEILAGAIQDKSATASIERHLETEGWYPEIYEAIAKSMIAKSLQVNARESTSDDVERLASCFEKVKKHLTEDSFNEVIKWAKSLPESKRRDALIQLVKRTRIENLSVLALQMSEPLAKRVAIEKLLLQIQKAGLCEEIANFKKLEEEYVLLVVYFDYFQEMRASKLENKTKLPLPDSTKRMLNQHLKGIC